MLTRKCKKGNVYAAYLANIIMIIRQILKCGRAASTFNCFGSNPPFEPWPHFQPLWSQIWRWGCKRWRWQSASSNCFLEITMMTVNVITSLVIIISLVHTVAPDYHRLCSNYHCSYHPFPTSPPLQNIRPPKCHTLSCEAFLFWRAFN